MKFTLNLFGLSPRHLPEVAATAEEHGFEGVWVPEHLIFPVDIPPAYLYSADGFPPMRSDSPAYDPWQLLASIASRTTTIRLGTNVFILPLRHPVVAARSAVTLDRVSGGRFNFGIGVGWMREEFEIVGQDFTTRGKRTDEIIPLMRRFWSEDVIEHHGEFYDIPPVTFEPKPLKRKTIPIYVGGTSAAALRRAGTLGEGWMAHRRNLVFDGTNSGAADHEWQELADQITTIERHRAEADRTETEFDVVGYGTTLEEIERAASIGVTTINGSPPTLAAGTKEGFLEWIQEFSETIISKL